MMSLEDSNLSFFQMVYLQSTHISQAEILRVWQATTIRASLISTSILMTMQVLFLASTEKDVGKLLEYQLDDKWDVITPIFKFSMDVRTAFYTTNAIESLNSCYRRLNKQRSVFPSPSSLMKALYLATFEATKKWTMPIRNWGKVRGELSIMYAGRLTD